MRALPCNSPDEYFDLNIETWRILPYIRKGNKRVKKGEKKKKKKKRRANVNTLVRNEKELTVMCGAYERALSFLSMNKYTYAR